jgi:hypothetical protein
MRQGGFKRLSYQEALSARKGKPRKYGLGRSNDTIAARKVAA